MLGSQQPRIQSIPKYVSTTGPEAIELAAMVGLILDPWEQYVLVNALGERLDGKWAAFEVGVNVARQNGKGAILEARELAGLFLLGERLIIHSAHQFDTSMEAFLRMDALLEGSPDLSRRVRSVSRSHGSEGFTLKSGQRLRYRTRTKGGGRGFTGDCLILDEPMILPESFHGALIPTLSAKSITGNPQVWYTGSAVDQDVHEHGVVWARIRDRGVKGIDPRLAYFEWSLARATPFDVTVEDAASVESWAQANPGLGIRISAEHIAAERNSMDPRNFAVERLGVGDWPALEGVSVINMERWAELRGGNEGILDPVCLSLDVAPDRSFSSIAAAGYREDGLPQVEMVDHRRGTGWVAARLLELDAAQSPRGIVCDGAGPVASLLPELEQAGVRVTTVTTKEHGQACGVFFDKVEQSGLRHRGGQVLDSAVRVAGRRPVGDTWLWSRRKSDGDISPLVASTLALWGLLVEPASVYEERGLLILS